jgi:prepilin-type N-terminal cleavage/methylation domain-containing protein
MNKNKGFTLIELLVVIAIIGILASVVLASLNTARQKGANAAIKSNLNNIRAQAELVYDGASPNSYDTVCADASVVKAVTGAATAAGATASFVLTDASTNTAGAAVGVCHDGGLAWAASVPLRAPEGSSVYWCVDSTGTSAGTANALAASILACS